MAYLATKLRARFHEGGLSAAARRTIEYAGSAAATPFAVAVLRRRATAVEGIAPAWDFVRSFDVLGVRLDALQRESEILSLLERVDSIRPRVIVEIGTALGGTLFLFTRVADDAALIVSIDMRGGPFGGGYPAVRMPLYRSFRRARQRVVLIRGDSHAVETESRLSRILAARPIDFLFIDGDHTYDGARADFDAYAPFVRPGGMVALHDIAPSRDPTVGVPQLWAELRERYDHEEFIHDPAQTSRGIGLLTLE